MKIIISLLALVFFLVPNWASADTNELDSQLRGNTFSYKDIKTGIEHTIYIGRFGHDYDEYFPCKFVDGNWWITKEGFLCLKDRVDKARRSGEVCLKPKIEGQMASFLDAAGNVAYQAKIVKGNALPLG